MKKILFSSLVLASSLLAADNVSYTTMFKPIYIDHSSNEAVGKILPTTKIIILGEKDNKLHVKLEGFMREGLDRALYFQAGKRIFNATMNADSGLKFKKDTKPLEFDGVKFYKASFEAYTTKGGLNKDKDALMKELDTAYQQSCSMCHSLHHADEFESREWPSIVKSMAPRAGYSLDQRWAITEYLQKHAKDMVKKGK